jgi:hypothetical protein
MFVLLVLFLSCFGFAEKKATLHEVMNPGGLQVDDSQLYVSETAAVYIYSLKDFKFVKKFGKQGEGPGEFAFHPRIQPTVNASGDELIINSFGKLSYFTKDGVFIKEFKVTPNNLLFQPLGNQFIGMGQSFEKDKLYNTVNLYNADLKKVKEIYRVDSGLRGPGKGVKVLEKPFTFQVYENKILIPAETDDTVDVLDSSLKKLFTIKLDYKKLEVTQDFKDKVVHFFKNSPQTKDIYELLLKPVIFPDYFPVIQLFFAADKKIYVVTWKREKEKSEFFIYDMKGTFLKKLWIPIVLQNELQPYPLTFENNKLYQLIENTDKEEWDLYVEEIK